MKILVTGGAGFIGSHITDKYIEKGHEVLVLDNLSVGKEKWLNKDARFCKADITDQNSVREIFKEFKPDIVNHHAAHNDSMDSLEKPIEDAETNILGSINILEASRTHDVKKVIYASSGGLSYGEPQEIPTPESHKMNPSYPYGISKHSVEHYLELYNELYNLDFTVLRYASVYGPRSTGGVIKNFFEAIKEDDRPTIFGDGKQTRDFIHVFDVAEANKSAINNGKGFYNIGAQRETSILELWNLIADITEAKTSPVYKEEWLGDISKCRLKNKKAKRELGWEPKLNLEKGLLQTWKSAY